VFLRSRHDKNLPLPVFSANLFDEDVLGDAEIDRVVESVV
jgi:hypothetical protein